MIVALRIFYSPASASGDYTNHALIPFSNPSSLNLQVPGITGFKGSLVNNKIYLEWQVDENNNTEKFEVEKSEDGKNFSMIALVFGNEGTGTEVYKYYEKKKNNTVSYRIKMYKKDHQVEYSDIVVIPSQIS
jgi:hypothetical protein